MEEMAWDGPKWGQEVHFPANPDLANILGDLDLNFENSHLGYFLDSKFLDFQVPRFPNSGYGTKFLKMFCNHVLQPCSHIIHNCLPPFATCLAPWIQPPLQPMGVVVIAQSGVFSLVSK